MSYKYIVMIGLAKQLPKQSEKYKLHRLLGTLFFTRVRSKRKNRNLRKGIWNYCGRKIQRGCEGNG